MGETLGRGPVERAFDLLLVVAELEARDGPVGIEPDDEIEVLVVEPPSPTFFRLLGCRGFSQHRRKAEPPNGIGASAATTVP